MPQDDIFINLITETKKGVANLVKYAAAVTAAVVIVRKLWRVASDLQDAYFEQEKAERKLEAAILATGKAGLISTDNLHKLARSLQGVTTFGDEAVIAAMAMTQQLANLDEEGLKKVTPAILDFSAAMGVDLVTAATLVGKTLGSSTNALSRYGVEIDATAGTTEKLDALTKALNEKFGGTAALLADTVMGPVIQLQNAFGDLREEIGETIALALNPITKWLRDVVTEAVTTVAQMKDLRASIKALESGDFTLADEINVAAEELEAATDNMLEAREATKEAEAFYGATTVQVQDLIEKELKLTDIMRAKDLHLQSLIGQQEIEFAAGARAAEEKIENLREEQAQRDAVSAGIVVYSNAIREQQRIADEALTTTERQRQEYQRTIDELSNYRMALTDIGQGASEVAIKNQTLIDTLVELRDALVDVQETQQARPTQGLDFGPGFAGIPGPTPVGFEWARDFPLLLSDLDVAFMDTSESAIRWNEIMTETLAGPGAGSGLGKQWDSAFIALNEYIEGIKALTTEYGNLVASPYGTGLGSGMGKDPGVAQREEVVKALAKEKDVVEELTDTYMEYGHVLAGIFEQMGTDIVEGTSLWEAYAKAGLAAIAAVVRGIGEELLIVAVENTVKAIAGDLTKIPAAIAAGAGAAAAFTAAGMISEIPVMDAGGIVTRPTLALLAKNSQPEAVIPLGRGGGIGGGNTNVTMHIYGTVQSEMALDARIASVIARGRRPY